MKVTTFYSLVRKRHFIFTLLLCFVFFTEILQAQTTPEVLWAKRYGGTNVDIVDDMTTDALGNIYITGIFIDETTFEDITLTATGSNAVFVAKTDFSGNVIWAKHFGGTSTGNRGVGITTDNSGNVYSTGTFSGIATFDSFTLDSGSGSPDIFVLKQNTNGDVLWVTQFTRIDFNSIRVTSIVADSQGNIYTTGYFYDSITIGNITLNSSEPNTKSVFIAKQDSSGNVLWAKKIGQTDPISIEKITLDASDNIYVVGDFLGTVNFDNNTFTNSDGKRDFFLVKLNSLGETIWAKQIEITSSSFYGCDVTNINIDNANNVYVTGGFLGTIKAGTITLVSSTFSDSENRNAFVLKTDNAGEALWIKEFASTEFSEGMCTTTDALGNVYVTGYFRGTTSFDDIILTHSFVPFSNSWPDAFVLKMNNLGTVEWAVKYGALGTDEGKYIDIDIDGNVTVSGYFELNVNFGGTILTSAGKSDLFLLKLSPTLATKKNQINDFSVYPNPTNDFITFNFSDFNNTDLYVEVFNMLGQKIKTFENLNNTATIDLSDLTNGIYLLKINHNETTQTIKIKKL